MCDGLNVMLNPAYMGQYFYFERYFILKKHDRHYGKMAVKRLPCATADIFYVAVVTFIYLLIHCAGRKNFLCCWQIKQHHPAVTHVQ